MKRNFTWLSGEWDDFFHRNKAKGDSVYFFEQIVSRYKEPIREYHNFGHIINCMGDFDYAKNICEDPDFVFFELMNHDAIYFPGRKDNEEKSAGFAYELAKRMFLPKRFLEKNGEIILPTKHNQIPENIDAKVGVDVDLSIFGKSQNEFDAYEIGIRKEYAWVPEKEFKEKRAFVLQRFLDRDFIYLTDLFREKYEAQARINLEKSINALTSLA